MSQNGIAIINSAVLTKLFTIGWPKLFVILTVTIFLNGLGLSPFIETAAANQSTIKCESLFDVIADSSVEIHWRQIVSDSGFVETEFFKLFPKVENDFEAKGINSYFRINKMLSKLNASEKEELLQKLLLAKTTFFKYHTVELQYELNAVLLVLQGPIAIQSWINKILTIDTPKDELIFTGGVISQLTDVSKAAAISAITKAYSNAKKQYAMTTSFMERDYKLPPRRSLSFLLKIIEQWPKKIISQIESSTSGNTSKVALTAYANYIDKMNEKMREGGPQFGLFNSEMVFDIINAIHEELIVVSRQFSPEDRKLLQITLDGSFINGQSQVGKSDIDFFYNDPGLGDFISRKTLHDRLYSIYRKYGFFNEPLILSNVGDHLPSGMRFEKDISLWLGYLGTAAITLSPENVVLTIFPVQINHRNVKFQNYKLDLTWK